jgi:hypothetical protein
MFCLFDSMQIICITPSAGSNGSSGFRFGVPGVPSESKDGSEALPLFLPFLFPPLALGGIVKYYDITQSGPLFSNYLLQKILKPRVATLLNAFYYSSNEGLLEQLLLLFSKSRRKLSLESNNQVSPAFGLVDWHSLIAHSLGVIGSE